MSSISITGTVHQTDAVAQQTQADALGAYTFLGNRPVTSNLSGVDLGTLGVLEPGVYQFNTSAQLTSVLTLDASDPNALFVFLIGTTLTAASGSVVDVLNGNAANVYWHVGSSATLGTASVFTGSIIADQSITMNTTAKILCGRAIALNAAVTLDTNTVSNRCSDAAGTVAEPATWALVSLALVGLASAGSLGSPAARRAAFA